MPVWAIAAFLIMGLGGTSRAWAVIEVPVAACSGSQIFPRGSNLTPLSASALPRGGEIKLDIPQSAASRLTAYIYSQGMILAPRGWHCDYLVSGGYGYQLTVKPKIGIYGINETVTFTDGYYAAAEEVAEWADTYFPKIVERLSPNTAIQIDNGHNWTQNGAFAFPTYRTDQVTYLSDLALVFTTPVNRLGVGTQLLLGGPESDHHAAQDFPINGFITLSARLSGDNQHLCRLTMFDMALPQALSSLKQSILKNAEAQPNASIKAC